MVMPSAVPPSADVTDTDAKASRHAFSRVRSSLESLRVLTSCSLHDEAVASPEAVTLSSSQNPAKPPSRLQDRATVDCGFPSLRSGAVGADAHASGTLQAIHKSTRRELAVMGHLRIQSNAPATPAFRDPY